MSRPGLPGWALQRVAAVLEAERSAGRARTSAVDVARRTGLSPSSGTPVPPLPDHGLPGREPGRGHEPDHEPGHDHG